MKGKRASIYLLPDALEEVRRVLGREETYYLEGTDSIFVPSLNTRYVDQTRCEEWPDIDGVVRSMTAGEIARTELERAFPNTNLRARKSDFKLLDISQPMYYQGQYHGPMYYVDLRGAYASIYRWLTLDVVWPRGMGEMPLAPVAARLWDNKRARNSLVGTTRNHEQLAIKGRKCWYVHFHNRYFNPALWHTVLTVLHDIAGIALKNGAIYVSTDCYIFKKSRPFVHFCDYLHDALQFDLHVYTGDGHIWGWGSYELPGRKKEHRETFQRIAKVQKGNGETVRWIQRYISK